MLGTLAPRVALPKFDGMFFFRFGANKVQHLLVAWG
jgi:hypothetical protein